MSLQSIPVKLDLVDVSIAPRRLDPKRGELRRHKAGVLRAFRSRHSDATNPWEGTRVFALGHYAARFSFRTPLNFFLPFFTAINCPPFLLRFVQAVFPMSLPLSWVRFFTAPMRRLQRY